MIKRLNLGVQLPSEIPSTPEEEGSDNNRSVVLDQAGCLNVVSKTLGVGYTFTDEGLVDPKEKSRSYKVSEGEIQILKEVGRGASSTVFKGFLGKENKFVAVKKINVYDKETRTQMLRDIKALIDAPKVPGLVEWLGAYHVPEKGQVAIILEYVEGGSLTDVLKKQDGGFIAERYLSQITGRVLEGLLYLHKHKHMVHRDIKPANILLTYQGDPKITDFGISAFVDSTLAVCHTFTGTVTYMSPERINNRPYSFPADVWSLGLSLIECATGRYPYDAAAGPLTLMLHICEDEVPFPPAGTISPIFQDFLSLCLQKDPTQRPPVEELLKHPFVKEGARYRTSHPLQALVKPCVDPIEKLDEIGLVFAHNYYQLAASGAEGLLGLAPLYSSHSLMSHQGQTVKGRQAVLDLLQRAAATWLGFGSVSYALTHVDVQPLGLDGSALVLVEGTMILRGPRVEKTPFSEMFVLGRSGPDEYYVANQVFRLGSLTVKQ